MNKVCLFSFIHCLVLSLIVTGSAHSEEVKKPKFGPVENPIAHPLREYNDYIRQNPAPDYWALQAFYVPQFNPYACSAGALSPVINALLAQRSRTADDRVLSQTDLLDKVKTNHWKERLSKPGYVVDGKKIYGTDLKTFSEITADALKVYGLNDYKVSYEHVKDDSAATKIKIEKILIENEKSADSFLMANYNQNAFTNDADVGHLSAIGAYDAKQKMVLIMDPDREYYEPYWVSLDAFVAGMATQDKGVHKNRGYVYLHR